MKTITTTFSILLALSCANLANAQVVNSPNSVQVMMPSIVQLVRKCSILPFTFNKDGRKVYHALMSRCGSVLVMPKGMAKIKLNGRAYGVTMNDAEDSDGDFFHVQIKDLNTKEIATLSNIPAYGDVLLAILSGDIRGIPESFLSDPTLAPVVDANLIR